MLLFHSFDLLSVLSAQRVDCCLLISGQASLQSVERFLMVVV
jgi:hypothetical protein